MITNEQIQGWFGGRLPAEWATTEPVVTVDRDEIVVILSPGDVERADGREEGDAELAEKRTGRAQAFREDTRHERMAIANEAQDRFERKVSWGVTIGDRTELWTHVSAPVMTRLRQPQRKVLDTLVEAGVARSRSDALAWCVRLVGRHEADWLAELRDALQSVDAARAKGPDA